MSKSNTVTCSFTMDREVYNAYKSIVAGNGENVKGYTCQVYEECYSLWNP